MRTSIHLLPFMLALHRMARPAAPAVTLKSRLIQIEKKGIMIGHKDDNLYGHNWHGEQGLSDFLETIGDYPAVMGLEVAFMAG